MKVLFATVFALMAFADTQAPKAKPHDHTIYIVHGSPTKIDEFYQNVGKSWEGGTCLDKSDDGTSARYWAFSDRTAPQARVFIFGTINNGVRLEIDAYDERRFFPSERSDLDSIALKCGFAVDPFFVTPRGELRISPQPNENYQAVDCALEELKASNRLRDLPTGFVGNEAPPGKGN